MTLSDTRRAPRLVPSTLSFEHHCPGYVSVRGIERMVLGKRIETRGWMVEYRLGDFSCQGDFAFCAFRRSLDCMPDSPQSLSPGCNIE
jgi:hypothetical protein